MHDKLHHASSEEFYSAIHQFMSNDDRQCFLSDYSLSDYEDMEHAILMDNNHAGFAIREGDVVSVFSSKQNPIKRSLDIMMPAAISLGGGKA